MHQHLRLPVFFRHVKARAQIQQIHMFDLVTDPHRVHEAVRVVGLIAYLPGPHLLDAHDTRYTGQCRAGFLHPTLYILTNGSYTRKCPSGPGKCNKIPDFSRIGARQVQVGPGDRWTWPPSFRRRRPSHGTPPAPLPYCCWPVQRVPQGRLMLRRTAIQYVTRQLHLAPLPLCRRKTLRNRLHPSLVTVRYHQVYPLQSPGLRRAHNWFDDRIQYVIQQVLLKLLPAVILRQHPLPSPALSCS